MRNKRSKVPGWTPEPMFALVYFNDRRDRRLVFGAKRTYDMSKFKAGFEKTRAYYHALSRKRGAAIDEAFAKAEEADGAGLKLPAGAGLKEPDGGE